MPDTHDVLLHLGELREHLLAIMKPEVLKELAEFLEAMGTDASMIQRYKWFCEHGENGKDCRYAQIAKKIFLQDDASKIAKAITKLYENWAKFQK